MLNIPALDIQAYSVGEFSKRLNLSTTTILQHIRQGKLKSVWLGRPTFVPCEFLADYLKGNSPTLPADQRDNQETGQPVGRQAKKLFGRRKGHRKPPGTLGQKKHAHHRKATPFFQSNCNYTN
jgi:excisionase family DNA binding protein